MKEELIQFLSKCMTPERWELFQRVIEERSNHVTLMLEDIYQPHNASAILRTADCFGLQDVHIIENRNEYLINPEVSLGASKWLNLIRYSKEGSENTSEAIRSLKSKGYKVVATSPHLDGMTPDSIDLTRPVAIMLGNEGSGLSKIALEEADEHMRIPMYGFTESFNLSVSAAMIIHRLTERMRNSEINWSLSDDEKEDILLKWMRQSIRNSEHIEKEFLSQ